MPDPSHQSHARENANRRLRNAGLGGTRCIEVHEDYADQTPDIEVGKRATVVPIRSEPWKINVRQDASKMDEACIWWEDDDLENIYGPVIAEHIPITTRQDPDSLLAAIFKRCNYLQLGPNDDISKPKYKQACSIIDAFPNLFQPWDENDEDRLAWEMNMPSAKRQEMRDTWTTIDDATKRDIRNKTLMVKIENLDKRDEPTKWGPRVIYIGSAQHNALTGPAMQICMKRLCQLLDTDEHGVKAGGCADVKFAYKKSDTEICEHLLRHRESYPFLAEGDYSRNDREQRSLVAVLIDRLLGKLNMPDWLRQTMLDSSEFYQAYAPQCGLRLDLRHQLPTGTTATTFRNSAYNMLMFACCMQLQGIDARAVILGDDLLAATSRKVDLAKWESDVADFKMVLKAAAPEHGGQATFLSRRLVCDVIVPFLVPKVLKMLCRYNVRATQNPAVDRRHYRMGVALSRAYEYRHVPQMSSIFIRHFNQLFDPYQDSLDEEYDGSTVSWFTKISSHRTARDILKAVRDEPVVFSDSEFYEWMASTYDVFADDVLDLVNLVVSEEPYQVVEHPATEYMAIDF